MSERPLLCHPDSAPHRINGFAVQWARSRAQLSLRYRLSMPLDLLKRSGAVDGGRADRLWQTTCFELFTRVPGQASYAEFNFAPSGQWAVYAFAGYRDFLDNIAMPAAPQIVLDAGEGWLNAQVTVALPDPWALSPLDLALCAVIEETDGTKSYWALAHPAEGPPDFHHPDCFALALPAPDGA